MWILILFFTNLILPFLTWLVVLRPYCVKHGEGYTPGANLGVAFWIDWQQAGEIAARRGDTWIKIACRLLLGVHLISVLLFLLSVLTIE